MSQKTNPLSLRLENGNNNFFSPWFTDFFFTDNFQYESEIRKYINALLEETQYSKAFLSVKNDYRKFNVLLAIQDTRAKRKEKQLLFNLKSSLSRYNKKKSRVSLSSHVAPYCKSLPLQRSKVESSSLSKVDKQPFLSKKERFIRDTAYNTRQTIKKSSSLIKSSQEFSTTFRKKVFESFLKDKQNHNSYLKFKDSDSPLAAAKLFSLEPSKKDKVSALQNEVLYDKISLKDFNMPPSIKQSSTLGKISTRVDNASKNMETLQPEMSLLQMSQSFIQNKIKVRDCFTFSEKVVSFSPSKMLGESERCDIFLPCSAAEVNMALALGFYSSKSSEKKNVMPTGIEDSKKNKPLCFLSPMCALKSFHRKTRKATESVYSSTFKNDVKDPYSKVIFKGEAFNSATTVQFSPIRFIESNQNVISLLDIIVTLLEKRVSFREIKSKLFRDIEKANDIKGIRISLSGRLGGRSKKAQKAKMQSHQWGETSLNTFSSRVSFASKSASTAYGSVGIKIWLSFKDSAF